MFWRKRKPIHVCKRKPSIEVRVRIPGIRGDGTILQASAEHLAWLHTYGGMTGEWQELVPTMNGNHTQGMVIAPSTELVYEFRRI